MAYSKYSSKTDLFINTPCSQLAELRENKVFAVTMYIEDSNILHTMANDQSLNLFVLQTGAAKARVDLRL